MAAVISSMAQNDMGMMPTSAGISVLIINMSLSRTTDGVPVIIHTQHHQARITKLPITIVTTMVRIVPELVVDGGTQFTTTPRWSLPSAVMIIQTGSSVPTKGVIAGAMERLSMDVEVIPLVLLIIRK
jgi:hypothetical protein